MYRIRHVHALTPLTTFKNLSLHNINYLKKKKSNTDDSKSERFVSVPLTGIMYHHKNYTCFFMPVPFNDHSFLTEPFLSQLSNSWGEEITGTHDTSTSWDLFWQQHASSHSHAVGTQHTAHIKLPKGTHSISLIPREEASSLFTFRQPAWDMTALRKGRAALRRPGMHRRCRALTVPGRTSSARTAGPQHAREEKWDKARR